VIDPNTGELVEGAFTGLLGSAGNGRVSYQIQAKQSLTTGTEISTQARVFFNKEFTIEGYPAGNGESTVKFVKYLQSKYPQAKIVLIWDGAIAILFDLPI
jgi:hypothetical protein